MAEEETTTACMRLLWHWIARCGIPRALYADQKNVRVTQRRATLEEQVVGEEPRTAFGKACAKLGIAIIAARSPQAKGRGRAGAWGAAGPAGEGVEVRRLLDGTVELSHRTFLKSLDRIHGEWRLETRD